MSDQRSAFLDALRQNPDDLVTPLVFSDWLNEQGEDALAEFIQVQCKYEQLRADPNREMTWEIEGPYLEATNAWKGEFHAEVGIAELCNYGVNYKFRRGFLEAIEIPVQYWIDFGATILARSPLLERVAIGRVCGWGQRLANCPHLVGVSCLEIQAWIEARDARAIANSKHLGNLSSLTIWLGHQMAEDAEILEAYCSGTRKAYPNLDEFVIVENPNEPTNSVQRANELIGRPIARAAIPLPRLYPLDFVDLEHVAGRLPDGTQVFVELPPRASTTARLICFTSEGESADIREMEIPEEVKHQPDDYKNLVARLDRIAEYLEQEIGFEPGTIRILDFDFPGAGLDYHFAHYPYGIEEDPGVGYPDDPNGSPVNSIYPMGRAGEVASWLRDGCFVFYCRGGDNWMSPDGNVEST